MPAFHQIGHDSENLLFESGLAKFAGAILSPLNYTPEESASQISELKKREHFLTILDPHLYRPQSERLQLPTWSYYPKDVDTAERIACQARAALKVPVPDVHETL